MRTATKIAAVSGGVLAVLAMAAGPAQAGPKDDPDVRAACDTFNRIGAETGLWTHHDCAHWRANRSSVVIISNNDWPIDFGSLPQVVNINGIGVGGARTITIAPPRDQKPPPKGN
ncbi:hypothetical protein [Actinoplanes sp. L3-i22]|uniref:hypothetical protein n=1 Tax=Actinoplanes sp. L3-i22 TaxID=2836373 RepID=UPI001C788AD3|nr:hypothetical protein [Actinoplanes sp. L3-i22]BCY06901.1 hypothetical protein L3i22_019890 [Actinoplanes sp. L3-i22]